MKNIKTYQTLLKRNAYGAVAGQLALAIVLTVISFGHASAATGTMTDREIRLSDSAPSTATTGVGSGTKVAYRVSFTPSTTNTSSTVGGIAIDFCSNTPLLYDTCTAPTGLNTNWASTLVYNQTNTGTGAFAVYTTSGGQQQNNRIVLTRATAAAFAAGVVSFELGTGTAAGNGITNPSTTGTFYARVYTFPTAALAQTHVAGTSTTTYLDYGGVALSTANVIQITARVQENIYFCVSAAAPTASCGGTTTPSITIGHNPGGGTPFIDSSAVDSGTIYSQVSTNAGAGATVRMRNSNGTCGGLSLDGGTTCATPPAFSGAATTPTFAMPAGTAGFGLRISAITTLSGGSGTVTASAPYNSATAGYYGMDNTSTGTNVSSTYGSEVFKSSAPVNNINQTWLFGATASNATPAGTYTANIAAIATGNF